MAHERRFSEPRDARKGFRASVGLPMNQERFKRHRLTGKRDAGQGRGKEGRETASMFEEELAPLRTDMDRRWKEVGAGNLNPWVGKEARTDMGHAFEGLWRSLP